MLQFVTYVLQYFIILAPYQRFFPPKNLSSHNRQTDSAHAFGAIRTPTTRSVCVIIHTKYAGEHSYETVTSKTDRTYGAYG